MTSKPAQVHLVAGARPNFMKIAPIYHELKRRKRFNPVLVHTGQHYDEGMSDIFFRDLNLPQPDHSLGIGGGGHGEQLGKVVIAYETLLQASRPDLVTVVGDVNATAACALAAKKLGLPVAHVESGLRSRDRTMPEEINRIVTDSICDLHLTPSPDADDNLRAEGVPDSCIHFVGNIMIDALVGLEPIIRKRAHPFPEMVARTYALSTFHRPSNVDAVENLTAVISGLIALSRRMPVIFPIHPRTRKNMDKFGLTAMLATAPDLLVCDPLGYSDFMRCLFDAALVVTDSGGVQEETTYLGIACRTVRPATERPITVEKGTNKLIALADIKTLAVGSAPVARPQIARWDGKTAVRIADVFEQYLDSGSPLR